MGTQRACATLGEEAVNMTEKKPSPVREDQMGQGRDRSYAEQIVNHEGNIRDVACQEALIGLGESLAVGDIEGVLVGLRVVVGTYEARERAHAAARRLGFTNYD